MRRTHVDDRGQLAPLVALLVVTIGLACLAIGRFGGATLDAARARTAADAAALAGAAGGREEAARLAARNGATLVRFEQAGADVRVLVSVAGHRATARARAAGAVATGGGVAPALQAALARAGQLLGHPVPVTSGFRTRAEQRRLYGARGDNPYPVAPPGASMHERGLAVDVPAAFAERLVAVAAAAGICRPYPRADPVHFELCDRRLPVPPAG